MPAPDYVQYKYGVVKGEARKLDNTDSKYCFEKCEDGVYCIHDKDFSGHGYTKFYATDCSEDDLEGYDNYHEIKSKCEKLISGTQYVPMWYEALTIETDNVEFQNIKKGSNGKYYLTYRYKAAEVGTEADPFWADAYFTLDTDGNRLVLEDRINYTAKDNISNPQMPVKE